MRINTKRFLSGKVLFLVALLCLGTWKIKAQYSVLHNFNDTLGSYPYGSLTILGNKLYGMTTGGGTYGVGIIFSINTNSSNYSDLFGFNDANGASPLGALTLNGSVFSGMTNGGALHDKGNIFSIDTSGIGYSDLFDFNGTTGSEAGGSLTLSGNILYGMTFQGGTGEGNIFSFDPRDTAWTSLINNRYPEGEFPNGSFIISNGIMYGMASGGGINGIGCVFSLDTNSSGIAVGYADLLDFNDANGSTPYGDLILSGNKLFGMTSSGGANNQGCIFSINATGGGYRDLLDFNGTNGSEPEGSLTFSGGRLYGMTPQGGIYNDGIIFSIDTNGTGYSDLLDFNGTNGVNPDGNLTLSGNVLYGMTSGGGINNDGVIFSYTFLYATISSTHNVTCHGGTNGSASVTASDGTPPYTYLWSPNGGSNAIATGLSAGTYTVDITDNTGLNGLGTVILTQPVALSVSDSILHLACSGISEATAIVIPSGGTTPYAYLWSDANSQTTATVTGLSTGTYSIIVSDSCGSTVTSSVVIPQHDTLRILGSIKPPVCYGESIGKITAIVVWGNAPFTYLWSDANSQTTATATGLSAGSYTIKVSDSCGASATAAFTVTQPPSLSISAVASTNASCNGSNNGVATVLMEGTLPVIRNFSYEAAVQNWTIPQGVTTITVSIAGASGGGDSAGVGASFAGVCMVNPGDVISVAVAGQGQDSTNGIGGGGGGGSFVYDSNIVQYSSGSTISLLAVAGGGGGGGSSIIREHGGAGGTDIIYNSTTPGLGITGSGTGGIGGNGGGPGTVSTGTGAGGAGWLSNGGTEGGLLAAFGGNDRANGFMGGMGYYGIGNTGGYGGGGGGNAYGGGAGAGYNGGGGGNSDGGQNGSGGGGGGSFLNGILLGSTTADNMGNGSVSISYSFPGGTQPYTYFWSNGATTSSASGLTAGTYSVIVYDSCGSSATASVTITQPPVFIMPHVVTNVSCHGQSTGSIVFIPSGGTGPYTYFLIGSFGIIGSTGPVGIGGLSVGTYTVLATNSSGCVDSIYFTITQPPALSISANILSNVSCISVNTGSIIVTASGGTPPYTYLWSDVNRQTTNTATGLSAGTYTVTVSDSCGSSVTESVVMGLSVSASALLNVSCNGGNNGSAFASISGGASPYTYQWNDPGSQTTATATGLSAGTYTVIVADSCANSATASVTVTQPAVLTVSETIITNVSCNGGENGSDSVSLSGGTSPYTYLWSDANSQTTATATGLSLGTYTVTVSDSCGSSATASAIMGLSVSASTLANLRCNGSNNGSVSANTSGGASPFTYLWSDADSQTTATANNLSAGTFTILVTDACGISATTSATVTQPPLLTIFPIITSDLHCNGDNTGSVYASASGGIQPYTFTWQWTSIINGEQTVRSNTLTGLSAGTYYVYLEDNTGCYAGRDTVVITQPTAITGTTTILTPITNCNGGNAGSISVSTTGGVPPYTYQWSDANSQTTIIATGLSAGNYSVTITDNTGCTSFASNTFTLPNTLSDSVKVISNVGCNGGNGGSATVIVPGSRTVVQNYSFELAVQHFWVPPGINTISINIGGASGGKLDSNFGGNGASFSGLCTVIPGDILSVVVGQEGGSNGGGGASWVYDSNVVLYNPVGTTGLLAVAAGGGGGCIERGAGGRNYYYYFGGPGGTNLVLNSATYGSYESANGGISGNGGAASLGGGGAGWLSNGQNRFYTDSGGRDEANHFVAVYLGSAYGGFGGGGPNGIHSGMGLENNGGGGGGYNGGGSGSGGGGGGSYFINTSPIVTANDTGNGFVTISYSVGAGIPPFTYLWSNGETTATATGLSAGVYTVTVEDTTGCSITAAVTITQAPAPSLSTFALSSITCFGGNNGSDSVYVSGGVSPYTYLWNDANSQTSITATGLSAGSYIVNVRDSIGCSSSTAVTITQPQLLTVNATLVSNVNCPGRTDGSVSCQASGGTAPYTYSWTGGGYDSLNYNLSVGTYTVLVTDNNGCTASDSISVSQTPNMHDTAIIVNVSCYGDSNGSITLMLSGGIAPFAFSWSQGATTSAITGLTAGSYSVGISDGCSVENFLYINISQPPPLSITADSINATSGNCNGSAWAVVSGGTNPYTYLWTGGLTTDTIANQCADYYCCTITDANGCIDSACVNIDASTGTKQLTMDNGQLTIFPNPNNGIFTVALSHPPAGGSQTIEIYNVLGEKVLTETLRHAQGDNLIDLKGQPNGMYFYRVINQDGSLIGEGKVVVEK